MLSSIIIILLFLTNKYTFANINIEPQRVLLNRTSKTKLLCTKEKNDYHNFEVYLSPNISSNYIQMSTNHLNDTTIEINIQSLNYIGRFSVVCLLKYNDKYITHSTIIISKSPGLLMRVEPCIVYYNLYIDCIIRAPMMIQAINDGLDYNFNFVERRLSSQMKMYRSNPQLIDINNINKTITFRWIPLNSGYFPLEFKMIIYATIINFGTTNHTMDMTPIFRISSNFTVDILSSTDLRINFNNDKSSIATVCHGNLTRTDRFNHLNQRENIRTFAEFNLTTIRVTALHPDTSYRLCFYCYHPEPFRSISDIECQKYKTFKIKGKIFPYDYIIIILFFLLFIIIIIFLIMRCNWSKIKENILQCQNHEEHNIGQVVELNVLVPNVD